MVPLVLAATIQIECRIDASARRILRRLANQAVEATGYRRLTADVETEPLRGEETEPREVFLLLV